MCPNLSGSKQALRLASCLFYLFSHICSSPFVFFPSLTSCACHILPLKCEWRSHACTYLSCVELQDITNLVHLINPSHFYYLGGWSEFQLLWCHRCLMQFRLLHPGGGMAPQQVKPNAICRRTCAIVDSNHAFPWLLLSPCTLTRKFPPPLFHSAAHDLHFLFVSITSAALL